MRAFRRTLRALGAAALLVVVWVANGYARTSEMDTKREHSNSCRAQ